MANILQSFSSKKPDKMGIPHIILCYFHTSYMRYLFMFHLLSFRNLIPLKKNSGLHIYKKVPTFVT